MYLHKAEQYILLQFLKFLKYLCLFFYTHFSYLYMCFFIYIVYLALLNFYLFGFVLRTFQRYVYLLYSRLFFNCCFIFNSISFLLFLRLLCCFFSNLLNWILNYLPFPFVFQLTEAIFWQFFKERFEGTMFFEDLYV